MTENLINQENQVEEAFKNEPEISDNSEKDFSNLNSGTSDSKNLGQSSDPKKELILGKFKSVEELSKAYQELQKHQGKSSDELGSLRKDLADFNSLKELSQTVLALKEAIIPCIQRDKELYNTPEYFQNETFKEIYTEALTAYGDNLDTDRMINLLEAYVADRIKAYDKQKSANNETQKALASMVYEKNPKSSFIPPKKTLSEMSEDEFRESIRKLI